MQNPYNVINQTKENKMRIIYMVINKETGISFCGYYARKQADQKAKEMTEYHQKLYVVVEKK